MDTRSISFNSELILNSLIIAIGLLALFTLLAYVCNEGLAPALEELSDKLELPHDVACATFLAFGSSAPEIFINCSAALSNSGTEVSLGALYGSALISFTIIPAACVLVSENQTLNLQLVPLVRDTLFFTLGMSSLLYFAQNASLDTKECLILILLFLLYLSALKVLSPLYKHKRDKHHFVLPSSFNSQVSNESKSNNDENNVTHNNEDEEQAILTKAKQNSMLLRSYLLPPFTFRTKQAMEKHWLFILLSSMFYLSLISATIFRLAVILSSILGLPMHITGLVIVAGGAEVPDTFASMAVARTGEGPSSISATMGSQITNIFVGVGVPYLISNLIRGAPVTVMAQQHDIGIFLGLVIILFFALSFRRYPCSKIVGLNKFDAFMLVGAYCSVIFISAEYE